jgi:hypothetical protein
MPRMAQAAFAAQPGTVPAKRPGTSNFAIR